MPYNKPYLTIPQQRTLLISRGMAVPDPSKADEYLQRIGYYRLSAYWYPFRKLIQLQNRSFELGDDFKSGTEFKHVTDLYAFDKGLRLLVLDAIERIEISVRTEVALTIGRHGPKAHRDPTKVDGRFTAVVAHRRQSMHAEWINKLDDKEAHSKEEFAVHFRTKHQGDQMPAWIAVELLDFGPLSIFLSGMKYADLQAIAQSYGLKPHLVKSWIKSLSAIRNVCAHHSRLWNKPLINQPALPKNLGEIPDFDHIIAVPGCNRRLYAALAIIRLLLKRINPRTEWVERLKKHMTTFPAAPNIKISDMGFPNDWDKFPLWN